MRENSRISTAELARRLEITPKRVEWHLNRMKKDGVLKRVGADKGGYWEVSR